LIEAFSRYCAKRFEIWQDTLSTDRERLAALEEGVQAMILARMPGFHEHAEQPALYDMIAGAIALAESSDDCCAGRQSGFSLIMDKFPCPLVRQTAEELLIDASSRETDLNTADPGVINIISGSLRMLAVLIDGSCMDVDEALLSTIQAGPALLAECPQTSVHYFRLLDVGMENSSALALNEAMTLGGNPRLDARMVANLIADYVSLSDVQAWLADTETRNQALRILIALPLGARPSSSELRSLVSESTGETFLLALKAYLGPIEPSSRDQELFAAYEAATSLESRLGILEIADFYRSPTLESALLDRVSSDAQADLQLRARAVELKKRFTDSLPVTPEKR
jgi:hypothetical protein